MVDSKKIPTPKSVLLSSFQTKVIELFNQKPGRFIHSFEFVEQGIFNPAGMIYRLKAKGATFDIAYKPATSIFKGKAMHHSNIAHYRLTGWCE